MTTKNAILLIVKQNNGVEYNSLLNKFSSSYSNVNSARAALSRSLKDLTTFGFLARKNNHFFILSKGEQEIYSEIKNKLVIGLNDSLRQKNPEDDIASVVSKLQVLIERSREDSDLLKTSKSSLDFFISDFEQVNLVLKKKLKHLEYLSGVFSDQIDSLKDLGFNDSFSRVIEKNSLKTIESIFDEKEYAIKCENNDTLVSLAARFNSKLKNSAFSIQKKDLNALNKYYLKNCAKIPLGKVTIFSSTLKAELYRTKVVLFGSHSKIKKFIE